ncbi:MAG: fatty acid desaturase [Sphaerospermopsis sp. SIO1G1]|nr:fatty acid desaturase [Sphaerospermopsis sp. SIO1G1]
MSQFSTITQELHQATSDLQQVNPIIGILRFSIIGVIFLTLLTIAWFVPIGIIFVLTTILAGIFYSFWLICTHDMTHQTLTSWKWFDNFIPRLISWPILSPYGIYSELHRLHHSWNGINLKDPERVQWTKKEYETANQLQKWYVNNQWVLDIFVCGGIGLIFKNFIQAWQFKHLVNVHRQLLWDIVGMSLVKSLLLTIAFYHHQLGKYLLFWFVLERVIGIILQTRDHLEHYGMWAKFQNHQLTQFYAGRNLQTHPIIGWLMGGLNYHAVHHGFPDIPFYHLPTAFDRVQLILKKYDFPVMELDPGYLQSAYLLSQQTLLIEQD